MAVRRRLASGNKAREGAGFPRVAVVVSRYNASITNALLEGAIRTVKARGGRRADVKVIDAPGAFELVPLSLAAARTGRFRGVAALGCIIKGQTRHDRYLAQAVATGLVDVTIATGVPVAFGVLTVESAAQARARAGGKHGNKGEEAMSALLATIAAMDTLANRGRGRAGAAVSGNGRLPDKAKRAGRTLTRGA